MISARLILPGISGWLYSGLQLTSHFGCGHIEIAFYEDGNRVIVYGIRNIIDANAKRIGLKSQLQNLNLASESEAIQVLTKIIDALRKKGLTTLLATPQSCVELSVDPRLLHLKRQAKILAVLEKRYQRLWKKQTIACEQR